MPNITGYLALHVRTKVNGSASGAFFIDSSGNAYSGSYWEGGQGNLGLDASRCSSIYNNNGWFDGQRVIPSSVGMPYVIKY